MPQFKHNDQTGCISQRQTHDNIGQSLYTLKHIQQIKLEAMSLDAEKAFNSVSVRWPFLYEILERFGFHKNFKYLI